MATTRLNFSHNLQLSTVGVSIISPVVTGTQSTIAALVFTNTGLTARTVSVFLVESGGTSADANLLSKKTIQPSKSWICAEGLRQVLQSGMSLQASQDAGTDINVACSGTTTS